MIMRKMTTRTTMMRKITTGSAVTCMTREYRYESREVFA
jgi:hypothetical protein